MMLRCVSSSSRHYSSMVRVCGHHERSSFASSSLLPSFSSVSPLSSSSSIVGTKHPHHYHHPFLSCVKKRHYQTTTVLPSAGAGAGAAGSTDHHHPPKKKKKHTAAPATSKAGRIVWHQAGGKKRKGGGHTHANMCGGCGVEVEFGGGSGSSGNKKGQQMSSGHAAYDRMQSAGKSKKKERKTRFLDVLDSKKGGAGNFLCRRCQALTTPHEPPDGGGGATATSIWGAYDSLRDVSATVFAAQLKYILHRRKYGFCVVVVDATDPEHSMLTHALRQRILGTLPIMLVINKIDLLPRMLRHDKNKIVSRLTSKYRATLGTYAVSALSGQGLVDLAAGILSHLGGRDVFIVGNANVGKSTLVQELSSLIIDHIRLKGYSTKRRKRKEAISATTTTAAGGGKKGGSNKKVFNVTKSNLPGTTLQAIRIACFSSDRHALWDTPGVINSRALQYSILPSHLMEPLTRAAPIPVPTHENGLKGHVRAQQTLLIEAKWMLPPPPPPTDPPPPPHEEDPPTTMTTAPTNPTPCVLARIDITHTHRNSTLLAQAYLHPSLSVRIVSTQTAPDTSAIPSAHIAAIREKIRHAVGVQHPKKNEKKQQQQEHRTGLQDAYPFALKPFLHPNATDGGVVASEKEYHPPSHKYHLDICLASLGWISFTHPQPFTVTPYVVEGSVFSKRPGLYPIHLDAWLQHNDSHTDYETIAEAKQQPQQQHQDAEHTRYGKHRHKGGKRSKNHSNDAVQNRLDTAAQEGRQFANTPRGRKSGYGDGGGGGGGMDDFDDEFGDYHLTDLIYDD